MRVRLVRSARRVTSAIDAGSALSLVDMDPSRSEETSSVPRFARRHGRVACHLWSCPAMTRFERRSVRPTLPFFSRWQACAATSPKFASSGSAGYFGSWVTAMNSLPEILTPHDQPHRIARRYPNRGRRRFATCHRNNQAGHQRTRNRASRLRHGPHPPKRVFNHLRRTSS
jgi:hypothetical protein